MSCLVLVKAALARFLFGAHTVLTVWRVVSQEEDGYWKLAIGVLVLILEGLHALCYRKGKFSKQCSRCSQDHLFSITNVN